MAPFASKIWPGSSDSPGRRSSVPVETTAARGRLAHTSSPTPAARERAELRRPQARVPSRTTTSPARQSPPRGRRVRRARRRSRSRSRCHSRQQARPARRRRRPRGRRRPWRSPSPRPARARAPPAARRRSARRPAAVPGVSAARTAKPSIAELANGGRSTAERASSARTRPAAAASGTDSACSGCVRARICRQASSTVSSGAMAQRILGP